MSTLDGEKMRILMSYDRIQGFLRLWASGKLSDKDALDAIGWEVAETSKAVDAAMDQIEK